MTAAARGEMANVQCPMKPGVPFRAIRHLSLGIPLLVMWSGGRWGKQWKKWCLGGIVCDQWVIVRNRLVATRETLGNDDGVTPRSFV